MATATLAMANGRTSAKSNDKPRPARLGSPTQAACVTGVKSPISINPAAAAAA
jgi:hypothetical protein